jgi:hypothetical protein
MTSKLGILVVVVSVLTPQAVGKCEPYGVEPLDRSSYFNAVKDELPGDASDMIPPSQNAVSDSTTIQGISINVRATLAKFLEAWWIPCQGFVEENIKLLPKKKSVFEFNGKVETVSRDVAFLPMKLDGRSVLVTQTINSIHFIFSRDVPEDVSGGDEAKQLLSHLLKMYFSRKPDAAEFEAKKRENHYELWVKAVGIRPVSKCIHARISKSYIRVSFIILGYDEPRPSFIIPSDAWFERAKFFVHYRQNFDFSENDRQTLAKALPDLGQNVAALFSLDENRDKLKIEPDISTRLLNDLRQLFQPLTIPCPQFVEKNAIAKSIQHGTQKQVAAVLPLNVNVNGLHPVVVSDAADSIALMFPVSNVASTLPEKYVKDTFLNRTNAVLRKPFKPEDVDIVKSDGANPGAKEDAMTTLLGHKLYELKIKDVLDGNLKATKGYVTSRCTIVVYERMKT